MFPLATLLSLQAGLSAKQPAYFALVFIGLLIVGGIAWLIASVLGFARARAFGASTRWFSFAAVCLLIYHIQFILLGFVTFMGAQQNDFDSGLQFAAFLNSFFLLGPFCPLLSFFICPNPPN